MPLLEKWLGSEETGRPFVFCISCKLPLLEVDAPWLVNKEFKGSECVLEYAICQPCREGFTNRFSERAKESVRGFLKQEIDWDQWLEESMRSDVPEERLAACISCRQPRTEISGFAISALFDSGGELVMGPLPLLICDNCTERMTRGLGEEGREIWGDFLTDHFQDPPGNGYFPGMM